MRLGAAEALSALGLGVLKAHVRGADVLLQRELAAVSLSAAVCAGPPGYPLRPCKVCFAAGEALLALVHGAHVDGEVTLLCEAAIAAVDGAGEYFAIFESHVAVRDFQMAAEFTGRGADDGAVGTLGWMHSPDMGLQQGICWERYCRGADGLRALRALRAAEASLGVDATFVGAETARRVERHGAFLASLRVDMRALEGLLLQMHGHDVFLEGRVLPEGLCTGRVFCTAILVFPVVSGLVSTQSGAGDEALFAPWPIADIVTNPGVGTLHVVVQMRGSQKGLVATVVGAFEESLIVVRAQVLL